MLENEIVKEISLKEYIGHIKENFGYDQLMIKEYERLIESLKILEVENKELRIEVKRKEHFRKNLVEQRKQLLSKIKDYKKVITFLAKES